MTPQTQIQELWGEGGEITPQAFEALALKLFPTLPTGVTFGLRGCDVRAGAASWATLAAKCPSLKTLAIDRVPCSAPSVTGLAAFLRGAGVASVTCTGCAMTGDMLHGIVGSLPTRPTVSSLDLSRNALAMLPELLPRVMPSLTVRLYACRAHLWLWVPLLVLIGHVFQFRVWGLDSLMSLDDSKHL